jgi:hypothetical protein
MGQEAPRPGPRKRGDPTKTGAPSPGTDPMKSSNGNAPLRRSKDTRTTPDRKSIGSLATKSHLKTIRNPMSMRNLMSTTTRDPQLSTIGLMTIDRRRRGLGKSLRDRCRKVIDIAKHMTLIGIQRTQ